MVGQCFAVNNFEWIKDTSQFNEDFIKNYDEESDEEYFLEVYVECLVLQYLPERMEIEKVEKLVANFYMRKLNKLST